MEQVTTKITTLFDENAQEICTGQIYPLYSYESEPIIDESQAEQLLNVFKIIELNRYYACIEKAKIVAKGYQLTHIHLGSLLVDSEESGVSFGYHFNPPLELHAWAQLGKYIIDFALPGTIELGIKSSDEIGPMLKGRTPVILAGLCPPWLHYVTHEIIPVENVKVLNKETAKQLLNKQYGNISK